MKKYFKLLFVSVAILLAVFLIPRIFGFKVYKYPSFAASMYPTISPGDIFLCKMKEKVDCDELKKGMIILFKHIDYKYFLTKRLIAKENQLVEIKTNNQTFVNNILLEEPYSYLSENKTDYNICDVDSVIVGQNQIFVMGDNRNNSIDSRNSGFGLVDCKDIVGRPLLILWSKDKSKIGRSF